MSKTTQIHVPAIHYEEGQNPPNMQVGCIFQTPPMGGFAYALLYSQCGKLVIQRARVGGAILTKDGAPHIHITDIMTIELGDLLGAAADVFTAPEETVRVDVLDDGGRIALHGLEISAKLVKGPKRRKPKLVH